MATLIDLADVVKSPKGPKPKPPKPPPKDVVSRLDKIFGMR